jgi:hypothetical protein
LAADPPSPKVHAWLVAPVEVEVNVTTCPTSAEQRVPEKSEVHSASVSKLATGGGLPETVTGLVALAEQKPKGHEEPGLPTSSLTLNVPALLKAWVTVGVFTVVDSPSPKVHE